MAVETIPRGIQDPLYRYKMPSIIIKQEGKGNGKKTVISNMVEVAKSLARPPEYSTKFFAFELGTIATIDTAHDKYIVNGHHSQHKLAQVLDDYIEKFVICKQDKNPETYMIIQDGNIDLHCLACGSRTHVDMRHKLTTYILNHPPPPPPQIEQRAVQKVNEEMNKAKPKKERKERSKDKDEQANDDDDDDVVWHTDTSKEAVEQRRKDMLDNTSEIAAKLLSTTVTERPDPLVSMHALLETKPTTAQILEQLQKEREAHSLDDEQTARLAFLALFDANVYKQIQTDKLDVIKKVATNAAGEAGVLGGFTDIAKKDTDVHKVVPHVLQYLYNEDVVSEEEVKKWHSTRTKGDTKLKQAAQVFVTWLETAEEEDSDEDEDDEDEEESD